MTTVLVTGFDPFGGEKVNPAYEAVRMLPDRIAGARVITLEIPTAFTRGPAAVERAIERERPDIVISVGQAGGRSAITVEKVAVNFRKENEKWLDSLTPAEADEYIAQGQFAPGSMLPKVQAAVQFAQSKPGRTALITALEKAKDGIEGKTGTLVHQ